MTQIEKPPYGAPCNGCGVCCATSLCPIALTLFDAAPCPALARLDDGRQACAVMSDPRAYAPARVALHGLANVRRAAAVILCAGLGCDAAMPGEERMTAAGKAMWARGLSIPDRRVAWAKKVWGLWK